MKRRALLGSSLVGLSVAASTASAQAAKTSQKDNSLKTEEYDIVIIGSGCAGLTAAINAADKGAKVIVLEKCPVPFGNTIYAGGTFNATNTFVQKQQGLKDTIEDFYRDMMIVSKQRGDPALTKMYCELSGPAIQWLTDRCGIKWEPIVTEVFPGLNRGHVVAGPTKPGGSQLIKQMLEVAKQKNIPIAFNTKVISLIGDDRLNVLGARALDKNGDPVNYMAKGGVILCTGGFHANKEMLTRYMGGGVAWMPIRGSTMLQGENILLTQPFFPKYVNMDQFHAGPIHGPTRANPSIMVNYGVILTKEGKRFLDESNTYVAVAQQLPKMIPDNWAYIVIDDQVTGVSTIKTRLDRYMAAKAPVYTGDTLEEMAKKAGLPPAVVVETINEYNEAVKAGKAASLTPPNTLEKPRLIEKGPFRCIPFQGGITATFGGPMISKKAEVLNMDNKAIPGLYAAGNAIGGLFYSDYIVGSQLTAAVIWGLIAAEEAAARAKAKA